MFNLSSLEIQTALHLAVDKSLKNVPQIVLLPSNVLSTFAMRENLSPPLLIFPAVRRWCANRVQMH